MKSTNEFVEAIKTGEHERLRELLQEHPTAANGLTEQGITFLQLAAYCRNQVAISLLREHKEQLTIFEAASVGDLEQVQQRLGQQPNLLNAYSVDGFTPLGLACFFGYYELAKFLIEQGADVNLPSDNQFKVTPLHSACAISNYEIAKLLLHYRADVNAKQMSGVTPLHSAAHNGQTQLVQLLLDHGADPTAEMDTGQTPLFMAQEKKFQDTADLIRQHFEK